MGIKNQIRLLLSSVFFQHLALGLIIPIIFIWQKNNGLTFSEIGIIQAIGLTALIFTEVPSSFLADKYGRKETILLGLLLLLSSFGLLLVAHSFIIFLFAEVLQKCGLAMLSGTEESYLHDISDATNHKFTKLLGRLSIFDEVGTIVGMGLMTLIAYLSDIYIIFIIGAISIAIAIICIIPITTKKIYFESNYEVRKKIPSAWRLATLSVIVLLLINAFISLRAEVLFQAKLNDAGIILGSFGAIYMFAKLFSIVGSSLAHTLELKYKFVGVVTLVLIIQMITFALLISNQWQYVIASLCVFFFAENIFRNVRSSFVIKLAPPHMKATMLSSVSFSSAMMLAILNLIIGSLIEIRILYGVILVICLKFIAFGIFFKLKNKIQET